MSAQTKQTNTNERSVVKSHHLFILTIIAGLSVGHQTDNFFIFLGVGLVIASVATFLNLRT